MSSTDHIPPMRRGEKQVSAEEAEQILRQGEYGVLSLCSGNGVPYGVPLSYAYHDGSIYVHCAMEGHKLDCIREQPAVSFCVVGKTAISPERFTTAYESVIVFGTAHIIEDDEKETALLALVKKYAPGHVESGKAYVGRKAHKTCVVKIAIKYMTGKASPARE